MNINLISAAKQHRPHTFIAKSIRTLAAAVLGPVSLLLAHLAGGRGTHFHWTIIKTCLRLLIKGKRLGSRVLYSMLFFPMFSTRYFEFDFAESVLNSRGTINSYLDISSPRFFPLLVIDSNKNLNQVQLINPDCADLEVTRLLARTMGIESQCKIECIRLEDMSLAEFDLISCISVLEHIPNTSEAVQSIWGCLKPGGSLILTVPCSAYSKAEFMNEDPYGLSKNTIKKDYFFQYMFDEKQLERDVFSITGLPVKMEVYGEKSPGYLRQILLTNGPGSRYAFWFEPLRMAFRCKQFERISDIPGEGVVCMEFVK